MLRSAASVLLLVAACIPSRRISSLPRGSEIQFFASRICTPAEVRFDHPADVDAGAIRQLVETAPAPPPMRVPDPAWAIQHDTAMRTVADMADELAPHFDRMGARDVICVTNRNSKARYALGVQDGQLRLIAVIRTPVSPSRTMTRAVVFHSTDPRGRTTRTAPQAAERTEPTAPRTCMQDEDCGRGARCGLDAQRAPVCRTRAFDGRPNQQYPGVAGQNHLPEYVIRDALLAHWHAGFRTCANPWLGGAPLLRRASHHRVESSWYIDGPAGRIAAVRIDGVWVGGRPLDAQDHAAFQACVDARRSDVVLPPTTTTHQVYRWSRGFWTAGPHHDGPITTPLQPPP